MRILTKINVNANLNFWAWNQSLNPKAFTHKHKQPAQNKRFDRKRSSVPNVNSIPHLNRLFRSEFPRAVSICGPRRTWSLRKWYQQMRTNKIHWTDAELYQQCMYVRFNRCHCMTATYTLSSSIKPLTPHLVGNRCWLCILMASLRVRKCAVKILKKCNHRLQAGATQSKPTAKECPSVPKKFVSLDVSIPWHRTWTGFAG